MLARTHETGGSLAGLLWISIAQPQSMPTMITMICATTVGSLLPDIDHHSSKMAHSNFLMRAICTAVHGVFGHRGLVHSPIACAVFGILGFTFAKLCGEMLLPLFAQLGFPINIDMTYYAGVIAFGFFLGAISHLVYDSFNDAGIKWLQPFSDKRLSILPITTGSIFETIFLGISIAINLILLYIVWQTNPAVHF